MPISVGSVEVDVIPNTQGIYQRLRDGLVPAATRAGEDAGAAAGRAFAPAMAANINNSAATAIGERIGQQIGNRIAAQIRTSLADGITQGGAAARPAAARQGDDTAGAFARTLRARLEAAFRSLPQLQIGADTSEADSDLQALRVRMETLADKRIGIDISETEARAEIDAIKAELTRLGAEHPNIQVRADTASAQAQLAAVIAAMNAVDETRHPKIDLDTSGALSAVFQLAVAIAGLSAIPAIPVLAAGAGGLASAFTAAGVGVGAFAIAALPAISSIKGALDAQKQAQQAANTETAKGTQVSTQGASKALQLAGAQQALATAERTGARQVQQARQALANAIQQAGLQQQQADRGVATAERDLTQAQQAQKQAQLDLVAARKTAAQQAEDLKNSVIDAGLAQQQAAQNLKDAQAQLDADVKKGASADQIARDTLARDQARQALVEQQIATKRLQDQEKQARKDGIEGSATVKQAKDALAQANQNVTDKTQALSDAQAADARTAKQSAQNIADARAKVADAEASAADSIASAQRQIASASLQTAPATSAAETAANKYQQALAKLTPSARDTFNAFLGLRSAFKGWSTDLQPEIMPLFTRGINGAKNALPGLTPLVKGAANAIGTLEDKASKGFKSPWWQTLKKDFQGSVGPAIVGVGTSIANVFVGAAGVVDAFLTHIDGIDSRMERVTGRFATWGKGLRGSPAFENFLSYSAQEAPKLADALGKIVGALIDVGKAVAPLSGPVLASVGLLAQGISAIATNAPGALQLMYGIFVATKLATIAQVAYNGAMLAYRAGVILVTLATQGWAAAQAEADAAMDANPAVVVIIAIVAAIALLVAGILYAWNHFAWFRASVRAVWTAIQVGALFMWDSVLKPVFAAIVTAALFLWHYGIQPMARGMILAFRGIAAVVTWWWTNIVQRYFALVRFAFQTLTAVAMAFYNRAIKPVFTLAGALIAWWWNNIVHRYFQLVTAAVHAVGAVFTWLYNLAIKPAINGIATVVSYGWSHTIQPAFNALKNGIGHVGTAFSDTKDAIVKAWNGIEGATKKPINFVLGTVWNDGIVEVWKKIGGWVPGLPKLGKLPLLAQGGTLPVQPGVFNSPTAIVGEGNPRHPEYVIPTDPKYRDRALMLYHQAGAQLLAGGGIIGTIGHVASDIGSAVSDAGHLAWRGIRTAGDFLADPTGNLVKLVAPVLHQLTSQFGDTAWEKLAAAIPTMAVKGLKGLLGFSGKAGGGLAPAGTGPGAAQAIARNMLKAFGWGTDQFAPLVSLWNGESGWRWNALNASSGAYGIPQSLPANKMASAGPDWRTNPATQITWGLNYIHSRYNSPANAWAQWQARTPHWYDTGGLLNPGLQLVANGTGRPEMVLTDSQWATAAAAIARTTGVGQPSGGGGITDIARAIAEMEVHYQIGDEPIALVARREVHTANGELIAVLNAGGGR